MAFIPDSALAYLQRAHTQGRLAHAYLITGPESVDREGFAVRLLQMVNRSSRQSLEDFQNEGRPGRGPGIEVAPHQSGSNAGDGAFASPWRS